MALVKTMCNTIAPFSNGRFPMDGTYFLLIYMDSPEATAP